MAELEPVRTRHIDDPLIARCQAGDRAAFEELFYAYREDVYRFSLLVVHDAALAQDVVQEAFLKVFRSIHQFQFRSSFKSWLYRVVVNEAITLLRQRKLKEDLAPAPEAVLAGSLALRCQPEEAALDSEERRLLRWAIRQLDPVHRSVVVMKYFHDFSDTEIAAIVGCPPGTVKSRLHRARELLRTSMARRMGRPDLIALAYAQLVQHPLVG